MCVYVYFLSMSISMSKSMAMSILFYNIDRTLRALSLVKNLCFIRVENIEEACFIVFRHITSIS